jgi:predicted RNA-binding Zn-ribbon protein involved in translation (DUF1610 family)
MQSNVDIMKGISFDSSLSNIDATVSPTEYEERLQTLLQPILDKRFPGNRGKTKIRLYRGNRVTFACPYCGDSMKSDYKKRGNFILRGKYKGFFKCHNCGEMKRIDHFFSDHNVNLDLSIINYIAQTIQDFSAQSNTKYDMSLFLDLESIDKYAIDRQEFLRYFGLTEVKESPVWSWLKHRLQYDAQKFMYNVNKNYLVLLNLTPTGKILGIQKRNFKGENKYLTYKLAKIYELMKKEDKVPDELDMISQLFNICLINYSRPVTLFEGPLDAFLFKNSIANTGIHKEFPLDIPLRYWFDDDKDGRDKSIEKINEGEEVFLWTKFRQDLQLPYKNKWDLNDVMIYLRDHNIKAPNFNVYFSNNSLDIIDI